MKNNIRRLRGEFGITQGELAKRLGVSRMTIIRWEQGKSEISWPNIKALMSLFKLQTPNELFDE